MEQAIINKMKACNTVGAALALCSELRESNYPQYVIDQAIDHIYKKIGW